MNKLISLLIAASLLAGTATAADLTDTRSLSGKNTLTVGNVVLTGTDATLLYTMAITGTTGYVKKVTFPNFLDFAGMGPTDSVTFGGITTTTGSISGALSVGSLTVGGSGLSTIATDTKANGFFEFDAAGENVGIVTPTTGVRSFEFSTTGLRFYDPAGIGPSRQISWVNSGGAGYGLQIGNGRIPTFSAASSWTSGRMVYANSAGQLLSSDATFIEASYLSGVTSAIQSQLDGKQAALTATSAITLGGVMSTTIDVSGLARLGTLSVTNGISTGTLSVSGAATFAALTLNGSLTSTGSVVALNHLGSVFTATGSITTPSLILNGNISATGYMGLGANVNTTTMLRGVIANSAHKGISIVTATGQTADPLEVVNPAGQLLAEITSTGAITATGPITTPSLQVNGNATGTGLLQFATGSFTTSLSSPVATLTSLVSTSATVSTLTLSGATVNRSVVTGTGGVLSAGALLHSTDDVKLIGTSTAGIYSGGSTFAQFYAVGTNKGVSLAPRNGSTGEGVFCTGDGTGNFGIGTITPSSGIDAYRSVALGGITNLAADTTLTTGSLTYCATLTGAITATLASPINIPRREIYFINVGSVTATLAAPAGGTIMGNTTLSIPAGGNISVISATVGTTNVWIKKSQGL